MKLTLYRIARKETYTIGRLYIDGQYYCDTIEDKDRDANRNGVFDNEEQKLSSKTAIPNGTYRITMKVQSQRYSKHPNYSRCKGYLPRLLNVPSFEGVLIHIGNTAQDSAGCILVGRNKVVGKVLDSKATFWPLYDRMKAADDRGEEISITVK